MFSVASIQTRYNSTFRDTHQDLQLRSAPPTRADHSEAVAAAQRVRLGKRCRRRAGGAAPRLCADHSRPACFRYSASSSGVALLVLHAVVGFFVVGGLTRLEPIRAKHCSTSFGDNANHSDCGSRLRSKCLCSSASRSRLRFVLFLAISSAGFSCSIRRAKLSVRPILCIRKSFTR